MPAYSFKERFVPMVLDGSKPHTIRARRAKGFAKIGDTLYLYFGMRTKWCRKLREEICTDVRTILIGNFSPDSCDILLYDRRLNDDEFSIEENKISLTTETSIKFLDDKEKDQLAWRDGFRPEGTTLEAPTGSFELMIRFWRQTQALPFIGDIIYWDPKLKN